MSKWRAFGIVGVFALVGFLATGLLVVPLTSMGVPMGYATVIGLGIATPAIVMVGYSWTSTFDSEEYFEEGSVFGDAIREALVGALAGVVGLTVFQMIAPGAAWPRSVGIGCAILGGYAIFIRRNREYFADDVNPWVAGKVDEWLKE